MINTSIKYINKLKTNNNLFGASPNHCTGYDRIWIRDNLYMSIAFDAIKDKITVNDIYKSLLNILLKYENKIDYAIKEKPKEDYKFIHPIYTTDLEEIKEEWGWKQNDAIGGLLYFIGYLQKQNYNIIQNENDKRIVDKLIQYLNAIQYWKDEDNGMWEENKEIHSSSVGACVAGLKMIKNFTNVPEELIKKGEETLIKQLPRESTTKNTDLSLLSLIYPYNIITPDMSLLILENIENNLVRKKGVIRYVGDNYYMEDNIEASWTMGLPWMAICYRQIGNIEKYKEYVNKTINALIDNMQLPELYIKDKIRNKNTPLGWSQALLVKALMIK